MNLSRRAVVVQGAAAFAMAPGLARAAVDARALHMKLIVLDTHLDMPANLARPGWDVMQRHHVEEDFTQVDSPLQKRVRGSGLGLSLCRQFAHLLGGEVGVRSTPGVGSVFHVVLPLTLPVEASDAAV